MSQVLVFSPYAARFHLTAYEGTIAKACQTRGVPVRYLLCDGLLPECDMHWVSFRRHTPRPLDTCTKCRTKRVQNLDGEGNLFAGIPRSWLGDYISEEERAELLRWAQSLPLEQIAGAVFRGYPVGAWVQSTMNSYFRSYPPDMTDWLVINTYRGFVLSAAIVITALSRYLEKNSVRSALLFNARQSITRVAFEILRERNIPVLVHETPFFKNGHILLKPNAKCWAIEPFNQYWENWRAVSLKTPQLLQTLEWFKNRRYGDGLSWYAFNAPHIPKHTIREQLGLDSRKKLMALFTSSSDENAGEDDFQGPYEMQEDWVQGVVDWVRPRDDVELVIRVHPHLSGSKRLGEAPKETALYERMRHALPSNVRMVMPDEPVNSYGLMDEADIGLSFGSTPGLEMAMLGKPVVLASRSFYEKAANLLTVQAQRELEVTLERSMKIQSHREIRREAFRMAYSYVFKFEPPFPLVRAHGVIDVSLGYDSVEELAPGRDPTLDRICGYLIEQSSVYESPSSEDIARTSIEEDEFFDWLEAQHEPFRDREVERRLIRRQRRNAVREKLGGAIGVWMRDTLRPFGARIYRKIFRPVR